MEAQPLAEQLRVKRSEMMVLEVEAVALRLFDERGFADVTVEEIAAEAHISARTFYRHFCAKDEVLQVRIDQRRQALQAALSLRSIEEPPLRSLRLALKEVITATDPELVRRWTAVVEATPSVLRGVVGGIQLKTQPVIAEFLGSRFDLPSDALVPTMLTAAAIGVMQAAQIQWFVRGGDLATMISDGLEVLERGVGTDPRKWPAAYGAPSARKGAKLVRRGR